MPSVIDAGIVTEHAAPPAPQLMPAPWMLPPVGGVIVSVYGGPLGSPPPPPPPPPVAVKVAPQVRGPFRATHCVGVFPVQSPVHAVNVYPAFAVAPMPSVIDAGIVTEHAVPPAPQLIPAPWMPPPVGGVIVSVYGGPSGGAAGTNVAVQAVDDSTSTLVLGSVPEHAPPQPWKR
jgi:hypothetical protein